MITNMVNVVFTNIKSAVYNQTYVYLKNPLHKDAKCDY